MIPWFSKIEGNTYATIAASPFPLQGKPTQAQDIARRISGAIADECTHKSRHTKYPSQTHLPRIYIICHLPLVFLSPTSPLPFYLPSLSQSPHSLFRLPFSICSSVRPFTLSSWLALLSLLLLPNMKFSILSKGREKI